MWTHTFSNWNFFLFCFFVLPFRKKPLELHHAESKITRKDRQLVCKLWSHWIFKSVSPMQDWLWFTPIKKANKSKKLPESELSTQNLNQRGGMFASVLFPCSIFLRMRGEKKMWDEMIFKMHVYIHTYKGGKTENMVHGYQSKQSNWKHLIMRRFIVANKPMRKYSFKAVLCMIYIMFKNTFSRTVGKKSTLFPWEVKSWYLLRFLGNSVIHY